MNIILSCVIILLLPFIPPSKTGQSQIFTFFLPAHSSSEATVVNWNKRHKKKEKDAMRKKICQKIREYAP